MSPVPRALDRFFFAPLPQQGMVACRIGFGLLLFVAYAARMASVPELYGPRGIGGWEVARRLPDAGFGRLLDAPLRWLVFNPSETLVWALYALLLASALAFALGAFTRPAGIALLLLHSLFVARNQYAYTGWAWMAKPFLLYAILAPTGRWCSIDAWRGGERAARAADGWLGPGWPVRLLQIHVCAMYAVAGGTRLTDPGWLGGEMLFVLLTDRSYARFDADWHGWIPLLAPLSYVAFLAEPLAPVLLWLPGLGTVMALLLMGLHLGLEICGRLGWWQWLMMTALLVFLPPRWLERALSPLRRGASGTRVS
jgi:HTTM domain